MILHSLRENEGVIIYMRDRWKRKTILGSTAILPKPLRVATRYRLLSRLEMGKGRRGKVFIIGHPKSGNTWLRTMISRLYQVKYGLPATLILKTDELANAHPAIPKFLVTSGTHTYEGVIGQALAAENKASAFRDKPVILLARHPCDIAVSWYIQFTKRESATKRELINHGLNRPVDRDTISMWDFVMYSELGLPFLIEYLNTWQRNITALDRSLLVRYEDLRAHPFNTLQRLTTFVGETFTDAELEEAVSFGSFDNLRQLEVSGFFKSGGLALRNPKDPETLKVRRGKVNGYKDDFTAEQIAQMDELVQTRLSPVFGYGTTEAVPQVLNQS